MRKLVIGMALASTALASPALARDGQWYVELGGGPMLVEDIGLEVNESGSEDITLDTDKYGYDFGGIVGYDFGAFRLEAEAGYRAADKCGNPLYFPRQRHRRPLKVPPRLPLA